MCSVQGYGPSLMVLAGEPPRDQGWEGVGITPESRWYTEPDFRQSGCRRGREEAPQALTKLKQNRERIHQAQSSAANGGGAAVTRWAMRYDSCRGQ